VPNALADLSLKSRHIRNILFAPSGGSLLFLAEERAGFILIHRRRNLWTAT
jgi:hypothetical protein